MSQAPVFFCETCVKHASHDDKRARAVATLVLATSVGILATAVGIGSALMWATAVTKFPSMALFDIIWRTAVYGVFCVAGLAFAGGAFDLVVQALSFFVGRRLAASWVYHEECFMCSKPTVAAS